MKPSRRHIRNLTGLLLLAIATCYIIWSHNRPLTWYNNEGQVFGTTYHITYQSPKDRHQDIQEALRRVDLSLSAFNPQSTLSKINRNESQDTDTLFRQLFRQAQQLSRITRGAFDITVAPLVNAWGFGFKNRETITQPLIDSLLQLTGYEKVRLTADGKIQKEHENIQMDFSAIAKGFGTDQVAKTLKEKGIRNFMIEIGGEISASGNNPKGKPWTIGIVEPNEQTANGQTPPLQTVITLTNQALATSGNYRNYYYEGNKRYAHTINPKTGRPVEHSLLSATIIAPTCSEADAYATACMVLGTDSSLAILKQQPHLLWYFICQDPDGQEKVLYSPQLEPYILRQ